MLSGSSQSVSRKRIVLWSPHQTNQFVVGASDMRLYEFRNNNNNNINSNSNTLLNNVSGNSINNKLFNSANSLKNGGGGGSGGGGGIGSNLNTSSNNNNSYYSHQQIQNNTANNNIAFDIQYPPDDWIPEDRKSIELKSVNVDVQYLKCMTWSPDVSDVNLLACGLVNGRTVLTSFSSVNRIVKEFVPKHTRPCNSIAWNPFNRSHIAVGLDKVRGDNSTLVWDINYLSKPKQSSTSSSSFFQQQQQQLNNYSSQIDAPHSIQQVSENGFSTAPLEPPETINQPVSEFTLSEATLALAWIPNNPFCLIIGTSSKWLRIYDTRDTNTSHSVAAHAKSVCGVAIDPFDNNRIATMSEDNVVKIWDMRRFDDPVFSINTNYKSVSQMEWCPTRSGILATSGREKNTIKLWDIKSSSYLPSIIPDYTKSPRTDRKSNINDQSSHSTSKPSKSKRHTFSSIHISSEVISSFSWHPTNECRMLTVSYTGIVEVISLNESIPVSWSPQGSLCFSFGKHCIEGPNKGTSLEPPTSVLERLNNDGRYRKDISQLMRERAILGYSAIVEDNVNLSQSFAEKDINFLWSWIQKIPNNLQLFRKKPTKPEDVSKEHDYVGIQHILNEIQSYLVSNSIETQNGFQIYKSGQRSLCMLICGWGFTPNQPLEFLLARLEKGGEFERATALAVFHLDIKRAISILYNGCLMLNSQQQQVSSNLLKSQQQPPFNNAIYLQQQQFFNSLKERENQLRVLSIALAGFGDGGSGVSQIWRDTCKMTARSFSNAYLRLCLEFLSTNMSSVESVRELIATLNESGVSLVDKIPLACRYFEQSDLLAFVDRQTNACVEQGDLMGIVLTGLTPKGIDLLQHYVDRTSDIQTAALATSLLVPKIFRDKRAKNWLQIYSDLLDNWQCWHQRADLDIQLTSETPPSQIFARCGYCQNSFSFESVTSGSMVGRNAKINARAKVPCCPHCKQQLPRCCLCMIQMNCMVPSMDFKQSNKQQEWTEGAESFDEWFTWCQTCRHGGHATHLSDWFKDHIECPVTDCNCKCSSI
ncbi:hypothetical protein DFA_05435 [Cavenderia fasciculata]|uniref:WD repeat protein mio zinc-ribbon like domain-containing protein n=1 Tax=Cavenderia fasciculata TaxID=261658 RepID=F4PL81_CACFS|nr:uncharacterized protein DFA_05435 [Cavenderia fasciculata]EGG23303.1 hypothetical protein DFA_05435 [Cavenderia fasciculata]|eukprot:XP_004361154.1 hypothetical protein DFA_05435 [Cavenderia fasciculata]